MFELPTNHAKWSSSIMPSTPCLLLFSLPHTVRTSFKKTFCLCATDSQMKNSRLTTPEFQNFRNLQLLSGSTWMSTSHFKWIYLKMRFYYCPLKPAPHIILLIPVKGNCLSTMTETKQLIISYPSYIKSTGHPVNSHFKIHNKSIPTTPTHCHCNVCDIHLCYQTCSKIGW